MKANPGTNFLDITGPNDIAYVIALIKNGQVVWDQDIRTRSGANQAEKKAKPLFTGGGGKKRIVGKSLWNKEGMRYFRTVEEHWKKIYNSREDMKILYKRWEGWIVSTGKNIQVGDGTKKTFHYVMGTWSNDEAPGLKETNEDSEDEDGFLFGDGYSSDRPTSRHSSDWKNGQLKDAESDDDNNSVKSKVPTNRTSPRLIKSPTAASGGRTAADTQTRVQSLLDSLAAAASDERTAANTKKREQLFDSDSNDDNDDSSTDSLTKGIVPTAEIRGSPTGNTKRGGRVAPMLRVPVEGSSGSPTTNTRGRKKRK
jgi:hypothetical protein